MSQCQWFLLCTNDATAQVEHPTLGWIDICETHVDWLGTAPSRTQFIPPMAAAAHRHMKGGES